MGNIPLSHVVWPYLERTTDKKIIVQILFSRTTLGRENKWA